MFICLPPGHPRCKWLCFFSRTLRFLTQNVAVCQSYNGSQWDPRVWETKKHRDKTKLNTVARDDTLRSKDTKRSVCARNGTVFISFLPLIHQCPTPLSAFTTSGAWYINVFWRSRRMLGNDLNTEWRIHMTDRFRVCVYYARTHWCVMRWMLWMCSGRLDIGGSEVKKWFKYCSVWVICLLLKKQSHLHLGCPR